MTSKVNDATLMYFLGAKMYMVEQENVKKQLN